MFAQIGRFRNNHVDYFLSGFRGICRSTLQIPRNSWRFGTPAGFPETCSRPVSPFFSLAAALGLRLIFSDLEVVASGLLNAHVRVDARVPRAAPVRQRALLYPARKRTW